MRTTWEHVAHDIRAALGKKDEQFFEVLSLSHNHLPNNLKPCFLYMGGFPEDYEIRASKLIRLWVAEGFLKSNGDEKSLEEEAQDCLKALVDRNLIVVGQQKSNGKAKSYSIRDRLRDACIRKADKEKFLYIANRQVHNLPLHPSYSLRRVSVYPKSSVNAAKEFMLPARSFLCIGRLSHEILSSVYSKLRLLRVLDVFDIEFHQFPAEILQLVNLRFLAFTCNSHTPSEISRLVNLQILIVETMGYVASEIWEMLELRHIKFKKTNAWIDLYYRKDFVQEKLQTISNIYLETLLRSNIIGCIPNIKNLGISSSSSPSNVVDLCHLHKLETLRCFSDSYTYTLLSALRFPPSLRKLTLSKCTIPWGFMTTVASLPNLEVLKIRKCAFEGQETQPEDEQEWWEVTEEEFRLLQFLLLEDLNLVHWRADKTNFPRLRHLVIRGCSTLKEIPRGIGEIPTLELIEVDQSSPSVVDLARQFRQSNKKMGMMTLKSVSVRTLL